MSDSTTGTVNSVLVTIAAEARTACGKGVNRKLRRSGKIPAILLDKGKSTMIQFDPKLLPKAYATEDKRFNLTYGGQTRAVKIHEIHVEPVSRAPLHVDLVFA